MVNLDGLVAAVQRSVAEAANALAARNIELFQGYFEVVEDDPAPEVETAAADALAASQAASAASEPGAAQEAIRRAADALGRAVAAAKAQRRSGTTTLRPKTTAIQYPHMTKDGPAVHTVHVPLIALAPISFAQITELRLKTELELSVQGDALTAGVPTSAAGDGGGETVRRPATLEVVLSEAPSSQGLRLIVEGYERALRAQIPG